MSELIAWLRSTIEGDKAAEEKLIARANRLGHTVLQGAHSPQETIARCEAELFILDCHEGSHECSGPDDNCLWILDGHFCPTVLALACARRHRPGFNPEWVSE